MSRSCATSETPCHQNNFIMVHQQQPRASLSPPSTLSSQPRLWRIRRHIPATPFPAPLLSLACNYLPYTSDCLPYGRQRPPPTNATFPRRRDRIVRRPSHGIGSTKNAAGRSCLRGTRRWRFPPRLWGTRRSNLWATRSYRTSDLARPEFSCGSITARGAPGGRLPSCTNFTVILPQHTIHDASREVTRRRRATSGSACEDDAGARGGASKPAARMSTLLGLPWALFPQE